MDVRPQHNPRTLRTGGSKHDVYVTDKAIAAAACRRRTEALPRELFNRRCNVEASIFQLSYHTRKKKLKYRGQCAVQLWAVCRAAWINMKRIVIYQGRSAEMIA
jgi:hypothetical protein